MAWRGQVVRTQEGKHPQLLALVGDRDELSGYIKINDWNQVHIIARGNELMHIINGHVMSILIDDDPTKFRKNGLIGVQIEGTRENELPEYLYQAVALVVPSKGWPSPLTMAAGLRPLRTSICASPSSRRAVILRRSCTNRPGLNPLWVPPWRLIEPSAHSATANPEFGSGSDARLLAGIMGHNLCLDLFGGPSVEEEAAGVTAHGESSVARYEISGSGSSLRQSAQFPLAQLAFERRIELEGSGIRIRERVENLTAADRPLAWTQHVTLGPPFLETGATQFRASAGPLQDV